MEKAEDMALLNSNTNQISAMPIKEQIEKGLMIVLFTQILSEGEQKKDLNPKDLEDTILMKPDHSRLGY